MISEKEIKKTIHFNSTPVGFKYQISLTIFVLNFPNPNEVNFGQFENIFSI